MAVSKEAEASSPIATGPLIAGEFLLSQVIPKGRSKGLFIQDIFHIRLDEGERLLNIPCPEGRIKVFARFALFNKAMAAEYMADGVGGDGKAHPLKVNGKPITAIACGLAGLDDEHIFQVGFGVGNGGVYGSDPQGPFPPQPGSV
jgi:hypothetical protein